MASGRSEGVTGPEGRRRSPRGSAWWELLGRLLWGLSLREWRHSTPVSLRGSLFSLFRAPGESDGLSIGLLLTSDCWGVSRDVGTSPGSIGHPGLLAHQ